MALLGGLAGINSNYPSLVPFALWRAPEKHQSAGKQMNANLIIQPTLAVLGSENENIPFVFTQWSLPFVEEWMSMKMRSKSNLFSPANFFPNTIHWSKSKTWASKFYRLPELKPDCQDNIPLLKPWDSGCVVMELRKISWFPMSRDSSPVDPAHSFSWLIFLEFSCASFV